MVSQANIHEDVATAFAGVSGRTLRWAIAKVEDGNVTLVQTAPRDADVASIAAAVGDEPVFIVYDYEGVRDDGSTYCKTCFICYSPDTCTVMAKKFELQNFKGSVKAKCASQKEMQINDKADLTDGEFKDALGM